jgi:hypothetical protein
MATPHPPSGATDIALDTAQRDRGGRIAAVVSAIALLFSGYSLWDSSLRAPSIEVFVPPVIQYSSPYQNSNFEVIAVPVTLVNSGGRSGTVLSMELQAKGQNGAETKHFYAADFGRWTMEKARANAYEPFAPMSLAGKGSRTETVLFYPKSPGEKPDQLIREPGKYQFRLVLDEARPADFGPLDRVSLNKPAELNFEMELRFYDARAFQNGALPMYSTTGRSGRSADGAPPP